ncbi:zeta toxin family protein [Streptomyces sp. NPDC056601]|uniref:zeta toxin family protein n=1 Tax=Streptomyces sp. NPDC056601 TaxID=3345875 RepID=UPI0036880BF2
MQPELPGDEWRRRLEHEILPRWTEGTSWQEHPTVVFVAGQPGSGKTWVADIVHSALSSQGGAVRVSSDLYKSVDPRYAAALAEDVRTAGLKVREVTRGWQAEVEAHVRAKKLNAVVEVALADEEKFLTTAAAYRKAGFRIEIVALAVPEAVSQLGVFERFVAQAVEEDGGRFVGWKNHDACARGMPEVLAAVEAKRAVDRVSVVRQDQTWLYENVLVDGVWQRRPGADSAVLDERARPWTAKETWQFNGRVTQVNKRLYGELENEDKSLAIERHGERAVTRAESVRRAYRLTDGRPGRHYHKLSDAEHKDILEEDVLPGLGPIIWQVRPVAVFVVGQPGSGKSSAADFFLMQAPGATLLSSDRFKFAHPDYQNLLRTHPRTAGGLIRSDYGAWQEAAEDHVRERRGHMVVEVAPSSAQSLMASVERAKDAGYRTHVVVIAAREADSRQGTAWRYYREGLRDSGDARFTTVDGHNRCYDGVTKAVKAAETDRAVDSLQVFDRAGRLLWHQTQPQTGPQQRGASLRLAKERSRPYTEEEALQFLSRNDTLLHALPQHQDELKEVAALARPYFPVDMFPRLPQPGEAQPDTALALRDDWAFGPAERDEVARHDSLPNDLLPASAGAGGMQALHPVDEPAVPLGSEDALAPREPGTGAESIRPVDEHIAVPVAEEPPLERPGEELEEELAQRGVEPETVELQEDEPEHDLEAHREVDVDEPRSRALSGEELMEAVRAAGRAADILATRKQTQQVEEAERARRDGPAVVEPRPVEAPERHDDLED